MDALTIWLCAASNLVASTKLLKQQQPMDAFDLSTNPTLHHLTDAFTHAMLVNNLEAARRLAFLIDQKLMEDSK